MHPLTSPVYDARMDQELKDQQIVVQTTTAARTALTALREDIRTATGSLPSEAEAVRRLMHAGEPVIRRQLGIPSPTE